MTRAARTRRKRRQPLPAVITADRARQLASLTYGAAVDWSKRGWMTPAEWQGYKAAYDRGVDGWMPKPDAWRELPPEVESVAEAITAAIGVRKGLLFDQHSLDDPPEWADYGAGSVTKGEAIALRRQMQKGHRSRLRAVAGDKDDGLARELYELFDDLLREQADWLQPTPAAVQEAATAIRLAAVAADVEGGVTAPASAAHPGGELAGDTPYEAAVAALEAFGDTVARHEDAAQGLEAQLTIHGFDRDAALMTHIRAIQEAAAATMAHATAALSTLRSRHGLGHEYHATGQDASSSAFKTT